MRLVILLMAAVALFLTLSYAEEPDMAPGARIFKAQKCGMCHKIATPEAGAEIDTTGPPNLMFVGDRCNADWMVKFLKKEIDIEGRKHKILFKGSAEELKTVTDWLAGMKALTAPDTAAKADTGAISVKQDDSTPAKEE